MFYEPGKTDHGLSHDPFKVSLPPVARGMGASSTPACTAVDSNRLAIKGMCRAETDWLDQHRLAFRCAQSCTLLTIQQSDI